MSCDDRRRRIQESLDGAPLPPEEEAHLASCDVCRAWAEGLREVDDLLRAEPELVWPPALTAGVIRGIRREARAAWGRAAAAAALLLAAGWFAAEALSRIPLAGRAGRAVADAVALPGSAGEFLTGVVGGLRALAEAGSSAAEGSLFAPGIPLAVAAFLALLVANGILIGRDLAAHRRRS